MGKKGIPEGDFRDWTAIRTWAEGLCSPLLDKKIKKEGKYENKNNLLHNARINVPKIVLA
jgi:hypothetical protein